MTDGLYVMTMPARWSDGLLKSMARFRLVSLVEIEEHQNAYDHAKIRAIFEQMRFASQHVRPGYFEFFLNFFATAHKVPPDVKHAVHTHA